MSPVCLLSPHDPEIRPLGRIIIANGSRRPRARLICPNPPWLAARRRHFGSWCFLEVTMCAKSMEAFRFDIGYATLASDEPALLQKSREHLGVIPKFRCRRASVTREVLNLPIAPLLRKSSQPQDFVVGFCAGSERECQALCGEGSIKQHREHDVRGSHVNHTLGDVWVGCVRQDEAEDCLSPLIALGVGEAFCVLSRDVEARIR